MTTNIIKNIENFISILEKNSFQFFFKNIEITNINNNTGITTLFSNFSDKNKETPNNKQKIKPALFIIKFIFSLLIYNFPFFLINFMAFAKIYKT